MVNLANDTVNDDTWYWNVLEFVLIWPIIYGIVEFNRLPKFIYINTSLVIITFIVCSILLFIVESGHDWLFLFKYPMVPGAFIILLLVRITQISKDESIKPYLASYHGWLRWISVQLFDRNCGSKFIAWFGYFILVPNILAAALDEYGVNDRYMFNIINAIILSVTVPIPFIFGTSNYAQVDDSCYYDFVWNLHYGWFTLYSCWYLSFAASNYSDALPFLSLMLSIAYFRACLNWRNDLWAQTRLLGLTIVTSWRYPSTFWFSRWFLHYAPWQLDDKQYDDLMGFFYYFALVTMCYAILWFIYCLYQTFKNIQSWRQKKASDHSDQADYDDEEDDSVQVQLVNDE